MIAVLYSNKGQGEAYMLTRQMHVVLHAFVLTN